MVATFSTVAESQSQNGSGVTSLDCTIPAHSSGDLLVLVAMCSDDAEDPAPTLATPSGWTASTNAHAEGGTASAVRCQAFFKSGNGSESTVTLQRSDSGLGDFMGHVLVITDADTSSEEASAADSGDSGVNPDSPSVTTGETNCIIVFGISHDDDDTTEFNEAGADDSASFLGTLRSFDTQIDTDAVSNGNQLATATYLFTGSGASGASEWTAASEGWAAISIAFRSAAAVTDDDPPYSVLPSHQLRGPRRVVAY